MNYCANKNCINEVPEGHFYCSECCKAIEDAENFVLRLNAEADNMKIMGEAYIDYLYNYVDPYEEYGFDKGRE